MQLKKHIFVDVSGAIDEKLVPHSTLTSRIKSVNLKFSDVLTQDTIYFNRLDINDNILEQYAERPYLSPAATNFTWIPPNGELNLIEGEKFQVVFANNDARTLSVPESNIQYEFI